jgi:uncharacterized protein
VFFEFDTRKSSVNKEKHGMDFERAQRLWDDPLAYEIDARTGGEPRSKRVGQINGKLWAAIFTKRGNNIRLISVRRAHENETREYEKDLD